MGDSTIKTRICRLCNLDIPLKPFGRHVKQKHQIDFIDYAKQFKEVQKNDELKTKIAIEEGYRLIRIWESEIKKDTNVVINSINQIL